MIKRLSIKNFQAHEDLELKLDPQITTVIGPSDVGKSSIVRAIRWVALNKPSGDAFIRDGAISASAVLQVDKHEVARTKGKHNVYCLDAEEFVSFGAHVPESISTILDLSEINFQSQHDAPFWFSESAGEVSRQLNQIVNLGAIDTTLSNLAGMLRKGRVELEVVEQRLEEAKTDKKAFKHARVMDRQLQKIEALQQDQKALFTEAGELIQLIETAGSSRSNMDLNNHVAALGDQVISKGDLWELRHTESCSLERLVEKGTDLQALAHQVIPDMSTVARLGAEFALQTEKTKTLAILIQDARTAKETSCQKKKESFTTKKRLQKLIGKTCPLCDQVISPD